MHGLTNHVGSLQKADPKQLYLLLFLHPYVGMFSLFCLNSQSAICFNLSIEILIIQTQSQSPKPTCLFHQFQDNTSHMKVRGHTNGDRSGIRPQVFHCDWQVPRCHTGRQRDGDIGGREIQREWGRERIFKMGGKIQNSKKKRKKPTEMLTKIDIHIVLSCAKLAFRQITRIQLQLK